MKRQTPGFYVYIKETYYLGNVRRVEYFERKDEAEKFTKSVNGECTIVEVP